MPYAEATTVPVERTKVKIERLLQKHGATQRGVMHDDEAGVARLLFVLAGRKVRLEVPIPRRDDRKYTHAGESRWAAPLPKSRGDRLHDQACRTRWRVLLLFLKAKLEAVSLPPLGMGISTVDREFLADLVLPSGGTVAESLGADVVAILEGAADSPPALPERAS